MFRVGVIPLFVGHTVVDPDALWVLDASPGRARGTLCERERELI